VADPYRPLFVLITHPNVRIPRLGDSEPAEVIASIIRLTGSSQCPLWVIGRHMQCKKGMSALPRITKPLVGSSNLSPGTGTLHLGSPFGVGQCPRPGSDLPRPLSQYRTDRAGPCRRNTRPSGRAHPELAGRARSPVKSPKYPQSPASSLVLWDLVHALRIMAHYGVCNTSEI